MIAMAGHRRLQVTTVMAAILSTGCVGVIEPPDVGLVDVDVETERFDWADWGLILSRAVVGEDVDYDRLIQDPAPLDRLLAQMARVGPETAPAAFPTANHRLAYLINCYNATILRSVLETAGPDVVPARVSAGLEGRFRFRVDGHLRRPADLRRSAYALAGDDWRIRLTLCDGRRGGPPLWRRPLLGDLLDAQVDRIVRAALASPRIVAIDHFDLRLSVWSGLHRIRHRLVREYEERYQTQGATIRAALAALSDRSRREELNTAVGYAVTVLPADDHINAFEPPPENAGRDPLSILKSISIRLP